jgi:hypothetical protein
LLGWNLLPPSSFEYRYGSLERQRDGINPLGFDVLPGAAILSATILQGSGVGGSARVKITFPDNTLQNTWLRVTVLANANTGLATNDIFYFGNVIGELNFGNNSTRLRVNGQDTNVLLNNQQSGGIVAPISVPGSVSSTLSNDFLLLQTISSKTRSSDVALATMSWLDSLEAQRGRRRLISSR